MEIRDQRFSIEIEFTGITRRQAAQVTARYFGTSPLSTRHYSRDAYEEINRARPWSREQVMRIWDGGGRARVIFW